MDDKATSLSLLAGARRNDAAAWDRLVSLYAPLVLHWCRRSGLSEADAADVFQEVFQAAATKLGTFQKTEPGHTFRGWLRTITRNKVHDLWRRRQREPRGVGGSEMQARMAELPAPAPPTDAGPADHRLLRRALDRIEGHFRANTWRAFVRTAIDGQAPCDVAGELHMTAGAVRVAKSRVLQRLREELGELR